MCLWGHPQSLTVPFSRASNGPPRIQMNYQLIKSILVSITVRPRLVLRCGNLLVYRGVDGGGGGGDNVVTVTAYVRAAE